jgi:hypothetical protein
MASSVILNEFGTPYQHAHAASRNLARGPQYSQRIDDIDKLIPSNDRRTLAALSSRLYVNIGVLKACVDQKADYSVGEAWLPSYVGSTDMEDGKSAAKFLQNVFLPSCDVRGGIYDWWKMLELASIAMDRDGDVFILMIKGDDGFPRLQIIPGHRVYSIGLEIVDTGKYAGYKIRDGVIYYRGGRPAAYRVYEGNYLTSAYQDIPASDIIHLFDPTFSEAGRGLPAFTHALEDLKTCLASTEDERVRQMIISRLHLTVFNESGSPDLDDPMTTLDNSVTNAPAAFSTKQFPGGIMYLPAEGNQRIEQMKHDNPGPVWEAFQDRLIRMAVVGAGWSLSLVWKPTGQGTAERAEIVKARRAIVKRQGILFYAARRIISWAYANFAENNRVPIVDSPTAWDFSRPPRLSVDDGRESKLELSELVTGSRNLSEVLEARGLTEDEFLMKRAWSVANRKAIAAIVSQEASAKYGVEIEIEDREMFMQTPNEMAKPEGPEEPDHSEEEKITKSQTTEEDESDND